MFEKLTEAPIYSMTLATIWINWRVDSGGRVLSQRPENISGVFTTQEEAEALSKGQYLQTIKHIALQDTDSCGFVLLHSSMRGVLIPECSDLRGDIQKIREQGLSKLSASEKYALGLKD